MEREVDMAKGWAQSGTADARSSDEETATSSDAEAVATSDAEAAASSDADTATVALGLLSLRNVARKKNEWYGIAPIFAKLAKVARSCVRSSFSGEEGPWERDRSGADPRKIDSEGAKRILRFLKATCPILWKARRIGT